MEMDGHIRNDYMVCEKAKNFGWIKVFKYVSNIEKKINKESDMLCAMASN